MPLPIGPKRTGLSFVDLLLVIAIMGVALGLIVPAVAHSRREAALTKTKELLRDLVLATHEAHDKHKKFPPYWGFYPGKVANAAINAESAQQSLFTHLLPFLGGATIYNSFTVAGGPPTVDGATPPAFLPFLCPLDPTTSDGRNGKAGVTSFLANQAAFCTSHWNPTPNTYTRMPTSFPNGTSNAIFFVTAVGVPSDSKAHIWTGPTAWFGDLNGSRLPRPLPAQLENALPQQPYQLTPQGTQVVMGDGSTRSFSPYVFAGEWANACYSPPEPLEERGFQF